MNNDKFVQTSSLNEQCLLCEKNMEFLNKKINFEQTTTSLNELCLFHTNNIKFE